MEKSPSLSPEATEMEGKIKGKLKRMDDRISYLRLLELGVEDVYVSTAAGRLYNFVTKEDSSFEKELGDRTIEYRTGLTKLREKCEQEKENYINSLKEKLKTD